MKEHPILFSAPMVRAILDGRKTQTRRLVKPQPNPVDPRYAGVVAAAFRQGDFAWANKSGSRTISCKPNGPTGWAEENSPYGQPGDRLWVRETWMDMLGTGIERTTGDRSRYAYRADTPPGSYGDEARKDYGLKWRPSIHMPRAVSRILLEITGVRVERLNDISRDDAMAEGIVYQPDGGFGLADSTHYNFADPRFSYQSLWESINGAGSWDANPWVWVVEFRRLQS